MKDTVNRTTKNDARCSGSRQQPKPKQNLNCRKFDNGDFKRLKFCRMNIVFDWSHNVADGSLYQTIASK